MIIKPITEMVGRDREIRLPKSTIQELQLLVGQFIQFGEEESLILQVSEEESPEDGVCLVSPTVFSKLESPSGDLKILEVTLGCDPEFFIFHKNQNLISAATYLTHSGQIGSDGALGELRPHYTKHERHLTDILRELILKIPGTMKRSDWARGMPKDGFSFLYEGHSYERTIPAGFHIHLGIPKELLAMKKSLNRRVLDHLVRCLDWYVSVPLVPLESSHARRLGNAPPYGSPGDYRTSNVTLEYRTPGGFNLRSPVLTEGMLGTSLAITESFISRLKIASSDFRTIDNLSHSDLQEILEIPEPESIRRVLLDEKISTAQRALYAIQKKLGELPAFSKHRQAIDNFFRIVEKGQRPEANLLQNWKE